MGLAASQAKLLSITSRLSDNELRSQSITAAKMALANQTTEASRKYINALNTNEFIYRTYDDGGNKVYTALTASQLSTYAPLKNQYALVNPQGQVLVRELDAENYKSSETINDFLVKYGVDPIDTGETRTVENPEYAPAYEEWQEEYEEWRSQKPDKNDEKYWTENDAINSELYNQFISAVTQCACFYGESQPVGWNHIEHIAAKMIDYDTDFVAYPGTPQEVKYHKVPGGAGVAGNQGGAISQGNEWTQASEDIMIEVRQKIKNNEKDPELWQDIVNIYYEAVRAIGYYFYNNVNTTLAEINAVDNGTPIKSKDELEEEFYDADSSDGNDSIIERLKFAFKEKTFDEDQYNQDYGEWETKEPPPLDIPETIDEKIYKYSDKDKAQWYVNLWHRMNGASDSKDGMETATNTTTTTEVTSTSTTTTTTTNTFTRQRWDVLEDGLMNSQDWLKYALESGSVSLERVNFTNPTEEGTGLKDATWTSIIYTNALDISEQTDEAAIAKAEAEYEQKTREIENKDKQYDSILKLLETEHSALTAEHDSIKNVIKSNTDRTLKIYSA